MARDPLLRLALPDGRGATLRLGEASTVLAVSDALVSSWDLAGRPYALVREDGTYRRGLDGRFLHKREATVSEPRVRRRLSADEGAPVVEAARREAEGALAILDPAASEGTRRLERIVAMTPAALRDDAERFLEVSGPVGILPPDQYLSLVVRATEGCSWNACTFCSIYRDRPFRWKTPAELRVHLGALRTYFGESMALRRRVFLGDANALCLGHEALAPLFEMLSRELAGRPLYSFVDAWSGQGKGVAEWRAYAEHGLKRVYVGLETGDPDLLAWLGKPGAPAGGVDLVGSLHEAGVAVGVIVLLGAGGLRYADAHTTRTAEVLKAMHLEEDDLLYFSELVVDAGLAYGRRVKGKRDIQPLSPEACAAQRRTILDLLGTTECAARPRIATYDIREFVY